MILNDHDKMSLVSQQKLDPFRWIILVLFCFGEVSVSVLYTTCTPISVNLTELYSVSGLKVALTSTIQMLLYPVFTFFATSMIDKRGVTFSVRLGSTLVMIGVCVRCLVCLKNQFAWVVLGSVICGIGRPFIINSQGDIIMQWFPKQSRTKLITLLNFIVTLSLPLGGIIASIFFNGYEINVLDDQIMNSGRQRFQKLLFIEAIFGSFWFLMIIIFFKTKQAIDKEILDIQSQVMILFKNLRYMAVLMAFSLCFGTFKGFSVCVPFMVKPFGFNSSDLALLGVGPIIGGLIGSVLVNRIVQKIEGLKPLVVILQFLTVFLFFCDYFILATRNLWINIFYTAILGFFIIPSVPLMLEWGCKLSYPISDSLALGLLYSGATLTGAGLGEFYTYTSGGEKSNEKTVLRTIILMGCSFLISSLLCFFNKDIKKTNAQVQEINDEQDDEQTIVKNM